MDRLLDGKHDNERNILRLLNSVEHGGHQSQRHIAAELGIAFGLVNAYLKRCVKKGLIKVHDALARRYVYYLTPQGFVEKSRLTVQYLSHSFSFFRLAKCDCARNFLRAVEATVAIVAVVDPRGDDTRFVGYNIVKSFADVRDKFDGVIVTDVTRAKLSFEAAVEACGPDRVLAPALLGLRPSTVAEGAA